MLDYHLHLWPHEEATTWLSLDQVAEYCELAAAAGVTEVALTEHVHRFTQAADLVGRFWEREGDAPAVKAAMAGYFRFHARSDLDEYVELCEAAKAAGLPVVTGLEVDYYRGQMADLGALLAQYPFDVLLGSVHWVGAWQFDAIEDPAHLAEWSARDVDACWEAYTRAMEELAATGSCDVLAHPDLVKVAGHVPNAPAEWWDRIAEAAVSSGMAAELNSAGWRKPVGEQYPALPLLRRFVDRGVPLTTASDAHHLDHVAYRADDMRVLLASVGVEALQGYRARVAHRVAVGPGTAEGGGRDADAR